MRSALVLDFVGCCPGCNTCYGNGYHCHQSPCRCEHDCICDPVADEAWCNPRCQRHRDELIVEDLFDDEIDNVRSRQPCSTCGEVGPCAFDAAGEPLFHMEPEEDFSTWTW